MAESNFKSPISPPYYAVIFTSRLRDDGEPGYEETAQRMVELAGTVPGFLGIDSARDGNGLGITVSYWRDEAAIRTWRENLEHEAARKRGREAWYECFEVHVAKVERAYGKRGPVQSPETSSTEVTS